MVIFAQDEVEYKPAETERSKAKEESQAELERQREERRILEERKLEEKANRPTKPRPKPKVEYEVEKIQGLSHTYFTNSNYSVTLSSWQEQIYFQAKLLYLDNYGLTPLPLGCMRAY